MLKNVPFIPKAYLILNTHTVLSQMHHHVQVKICILITGGLSHQYHQN